MLGLDDHPDACWLEVGPVSLLEVSDVRKYFPIKTRDLLPARGRAGARRRRRQPVRRGGPDAGRGGESGCGKSTLARCMTGLHEVTSGEIAFDGDVRRDVQMVFQDPYGSLNPRRRIGSIIADPLVIHREGTPSSRTGPGAGPDGAGRAQPRALQPLPRRVLRRPAAARGHRAGAGAQPAPGRLRRAGLRAGRLHPGPGREPAQGPADRPGPDLRLHRPRPLGGPVRQRPRGASCISARSSRSPRARSSTSAPGTRTRRRCCRPPRSPTRTGRGTASCCAATSLHPSRRRPGCRFHPRCPKAQERCRVEEPLLLGDGHKWACHFPLEPGERLAEPRRQANETIRADRERRAA